MKLEIYSVYDKKAEKFETPFTMFNQAVAVRLFKTQVEDPTMLIGKNPEDFSLFYCGEFDVIQGKIKVDKSTPREIISALACRSEN